MVFSLIFDKITSNKAVYPQCRCALALIRTVSDILKTDLKLKKMRQSSKKVHFFLLL